MSRKTQLPKPILFTKNGYQALILEREKLLEDRKLAVSELQRAREMGDLKENGFYRGARFKLSGIDRRIKELNYQIRFGKVTESVSSDSIVIGSYVTVTDGKQTYGYMLVGEYEADPAKNKLSNKSPIGYQLMGKKRGDKVCIQIPLGQITYTVLDISFHSTG